MAKLVEKIQKVLPRTWTPNQVVAHNVTRARLLRGWTQDQAAEALAPYLGSRLSLASFSAMERSIRGTRVRQFSADDLVALSRAFRVPVGFWFTPPDEGALHVPDHARTGIDFSELVDVVLGTPETIPAWTDLLEKWASAMAEKPASGRDAGRQQPARQGDERARMLVRERFGDLAGAGATLRRLADVLDALDRPARGGTTKRGAQPSEARTPASAKQAGGRTG